ncbi:LYR motif-containing protein 1-like [Lineus longissimus]|uniref:LYR motif-containing protein 1-like n=1 Tax=Lineus longissimus TaxID=88925 RepID=UPI002B4C7A53
MSLRSHVLSTYRKVLREATRWQAASGSTTDTWKEREYIKDEARRLFKRNKELTDEDEIKQHVKEANSRLEMAIHYKNPYPRPLNYPQTLLPPSERRKPISLEKTMKQAKPVYMKSYDD